MPDPLEVLPEELWIRCIDLATRDQPAGSLELILVSVRWEQSLLRTPSLWTRIYVQNEEDEMARVWTFLHLSKGCQLGVNIATMLPTTNALELIEPHILRLKRVSIKPVITSALYGEQWQQTASQILALWRLTPSSGKGSSYRIHIVRDNGRDPWPHRITVMQFTTGNTLAEVVRSNELLCSDSSHLFEERTLFCRWEGYIAKCASTAYGARRLRLACFDGGGIHCFSQLCTMKRLMRAISIDVNATEPYKDMRPCDYFDLIGGSDAGGIIAIMFAKLQMSVDEVMEAFAAICESVYANDLSPSERTAILKSMIEGILLRRGNPIDLELEDIQRDGRCLGFVTVTAIADVAKIRCLRTYHVPGEPPSGITVVDAALATCASPSTFLPVDLGPIGLERQSFIGGGIGASNPSHQVLLEATSHLNGGESMTPLLLSLGSGYTGVLSPGVKSKDNSPEHRLMRTILKDVEHTAQEIEQRRAHRQMYFRFSVGQWIQGEARTNVERLKEIEAQTNTYLALPHVASQVDKLGDAWWSISGFHMQCMKAQLPQHEPAKLFKTNSL